MFKRMETKHKGRKLKNKRQGQIAIFLLMVFQLLFVLFAMTVNIALTVHDKINLQNSVDLAALYGAKKQAEVLNAIAHINFQIRQSYKLLAWRFRILSTIPVTKYEIISNEWCPQNRDGTLTGTCEGRYAACFSADIWRRGIKATGSQEQNLCLNTDITIEDPQPIPPIFPAPYNIDAAIRQMQLKDDLNQSCNGESFINWLMTQVFLSHFRLDQKDRKMMIHAIYEASLKQDLDLDGKSIKDGVKDTFEKNLTFINRQNSPTLETFNSLSFDPTDITDFLEPQNTLPILEYLHFGRGPGNGDNCSNIHQRFSHQNPFDPSDPFFDMDDRIIRENGYKAYVNQWLPLFKYNQYSSPPSEQFIAPLTLSYRKKPDVTVYYGVSAKLTQSTKPQLFSPSSSLQLKASAFAKPFGGRIGPPTDTTDPLPSESIKPNYSRYPGDPHGLRDIKAHMMYYLKKSDLHTGRTFFNVNNYADLASGDALATPASGSKFNFILRLMEMMVISPNIFELLNYSISNNYMETYFPKICKLIGSGADCFSSVEEITAPVPGATVPGYIRGDFGHPLTNDYTTQNQTITVSSFVPFFFFSPGNELRFSSASPGGFANFVSKIKPPYLIKDPSHFLTGFMPTTSPLRYEDYNASSPPPKPFMKCYQPTQHPKHIPSGCAVGGRSGYSVKLISCDTVSSQPGIEPTNLDVYCQ